MAFTKSGFYKGAAPIKTGMSASGNEWRARRFYIETDEQFPSTIEFDLSGDNVQLVDGLSLGELITVSFDVGGRVWTNPDTGKRKVFNRLSVFKIARGDDTARPLPVATDATDATNSDDDLPF